MAESSETIRPAVAEPNWMIIQNLFVDLELGEAFAETARLVASPELQQEAKQDALRVYRYVKDSSTKAHMSELTRCDLNEGLECLRTSLVALGLEA